MIKLLALFFRFARISIHIINDTILFTNTLFIISFVVVITMFIRFLLFNRLLSRSQCLVFSRLWNWLWRRFAPLMPENKPAIDDFDVASSFALLGIYSI
jgi:hypothetical protein